MVAKSLRIRKIDLNTCRLPTIISAGGFAFQDFVATVLQREPIYCNGYCNANHFIVVQVAYVVSSNKKISEFYPKLFQI